MNKAVKLAVSAAIAAAGVCGAMADESVYMRIKSADAHGNQWVDTGIDGGTDLAVDMSFNTGYFYNGSKHALLGGAWSSKCSQKTYTLGITDGRIRYYGAMTQLVMPPSDSDVRIQLTTTAADNAIADYGTTRTLSTVSLACNDSEPLTLFADSQHGCGSNMKLYRCKMVKAGELVRDFAAVSNLTTGAVGLYDFSGTSAEPFYPGESSNAGTLTAGEPVPFSVEASAGESTAAGQRTIVWSTDGFRVGASVTATAILSTSADYSGATTVLDQALSFGDQVSEKTLELTGLTSGVKHYLKFTVSDDLGNEVVKELSFLATGEADVYPGGDLQAALNAARAEIAGGAASATVRVAPGNYDITAPLDLDRPIHLVGLGGPEATSINQKSRNMNASVIPRVVTLTAAGASVEGLTLTIPQYTFSANKTVSGGAVYMTADALVTNCVIRGPGFDQSFGGQNRPVNGTGIYMTAGRVVDALVTDIHSGSDGVGVYLAGAGTLANSEVRNCCGGTLVHAYGGGCGGGIRINNPNAVVTNVYVHDCQTTYHSGAGVFVSNGLLVDSRVCGCSNVVSGTSHHANIEGIGVYQTGGTVKNCVIAGNRMLNGDPADYWYKTTPTVSGTQMSTYVAGEGNVPRTPVFADAANRDWTVVKSFVASAIDILPETSVTFEAEETDGSGYSWDFGDGGSATGASAAHTFATAGRYDVTLRYTTAQGESVERTRADYIRVYSASGKAYVRADAGVGTFPYDEVSKATSNIWQAAEAVRHATEAGVTQATVDVGEGVFPTWHPVVLDGPIAFNGAGPDRTSLISAADSNMVRPLELAHVDAVARDLAVSGRWAMQAALGGGVYGVSLLMSAGLVTNCVVEGTTGGGQNWILNGSLAARGGTVLDTVIRNNTLGAYGNGLYMDGTALADRCVITNNACAGNQYNSQVGGGAYVAGKATLRNSLIARNSLVYYAGAGVYLNSGDATVESCTIVGNTTASGGQSGAGAYVNNGTLRNCIVRDNTLAGVANDITRSTSTKAVVTYCSSSEIIAGDGNTTAAPAFADAANDDWHLKNGSVGIDIGVNTEAASTWLDLDRKTRIRDGSGGGEPIIDMGCYEFVLGGEGLSATFNITGSDGGVGTLTTTFAAVVLYNGNVLTDYTGCTFVWDFGDGSQEQGEGASGASVSHTYEGGQKRSVSLTVTRGGETSETFVREDCIAVYSDHVYLSNAGSATFPYETPAKATASVADAFDVLTMASQYGAERCRMDVGEGTFTVPKTLDFTFPCDIVGLGPNRSILSSEVPMNTMLKLSADQSVLTGLTLRDAAAGNAAGGAVGMTSDSLVTNCVFTGNTACYHGYGGGKGAAVCASKGLVVDCLMTGNGHDYGSTVWIEGTAQMDRCVITNNVGGMWSHSQGGAGVTVNGKGVVRNCLIANNRNTYCAGAGVYDFGGQPTVENCTIVGNWIGPNADQPQYRGLAAGVHAPDRYALYMTNCIVNCNTNLDVEINIGDPNLPNHVGYLKVGYSAAPELTNGVGNVAANADFKDRAAGDYHLKPESARHFKGRFEDWMPGAFDLDHLPRCRGRRVDMGCYSAPPGLMLIVR